MDKSFRRLYNEAFTPEFYEGFLGEMERRLGCGIPFRVAETPVFMPDDLRERLCSASNEILDVISAPGLVDRLKKAVPHHFDAPGMDDIPNCIQVDFAVVRHPDGHLEGKVVELQAFPSLYALMVVQSDIIGQRLQAIEGLGRDWSIYFSGLDRARFVDKLHKAVLAGEDPESVVLIDLDPDNQKTYPDFIATQQLVGIDPVCITQLEREGRRLFRRVGKKRVQVRRIYNRLVFDEIMNKDLDLPFSFRDDLDLSWFSHPNWYWTYSKYTLPHVEHPAIPRAHFLSELKSVPDDLENYVLKPLFSFAGSGVKIDVTKKDLDEVPDEDRDKWLLQEKVAYEPALHMPDGTGVKAEVRMMFLRGPDQPRPELVLNLVRLSRGKMLGVDHNRNMTWVGGSVGMWPIDD